MKRKEKFPDTEYFRYYNANPKNRITGDCRIRAIANACEVPYNQVVMDLAQIQCETGYDQTCNQGLNILLKKYGWLKMAQPRKSDNTKYMGWEFCKVLQDNIDSWNYDGIAISDRIIANVGGHHMVAIINGRIEDIWDSSWGCVGNYWVKAGWSERRR